MGTITYKGGKNPLPGTEDDGIRMNNYLRKKGFTVTWMNDFRHSERDEKGVLDELYPSYENIKKKIFAFTEGRDKNDVLWFHFSGHGTQIGGSKNEADGKDEALVPVKWDGKAETLVDDDWLYENFVRGIPIGTETLAMLDCCHSGSALDMPYYFDMAQGQFVPTNDPAVRPATADDQQQGKHAIPEGVRLIQISGCADDQTSKELTWSNQETGVVTKRGGLLTLSFLEAVAGTKDGEEFHGDQITVKELATQLTEEGAKK